MKTTLTAMYGCKNRLISCYSVFIAYDEINILIYIK